MICLIYVARFKILPPYIDRQKDSCQSVRLSISLNGVHMIISILNQKGGVGKTTIAVNLARYFTKIGKKTLIVDSDPQGSALSWHERSNGDLMDMVCLSKTTFLKDIEMFTDSYDYIFVDGVPRVSPLTICAIRCADIVLIPVQPSPYDIWATEEIVRHAKDRHQITNGKLKAAFIISRKITNTIIAREIHSELIRMDLPTFSRGTCQRVAYATSVEKGITVLDGEYYGSEACLEIELLCQELEAFINGTEFTLDFELHYQAFMDSLED